MDLFTALDPRTEYSRTQLQLIVGAWVLATPIEPKAKVALDSGDVAEADYDKRSIYSLLYSLYRTIGIVRTESGEPYEFTFNTWGYAWPYTWGARPTRATDPERFGKNAYTGLFHFAAAKHYLRSRRDAVHIVEMGCGTGAGAHHLMKNVLPRCTWEAVDMQAAAIQTCKRKFVPSLDGRLKATLGNCTDLTIADGVADFVLVCETHVTEVPGRVTDEDEKFFLTAHRLLKPGGLFLWANAIPHDTWQPCFNFLASLGMTQIEVCDVTREAIRARDEDKRRAEQYVDQVLKRMWGFRIPGFGRKKRIEARQAMLNFYRNPGTRLYERLVDGGDTYKVVCFQKQKQS